MKLFRRRRAAPPAAPEWASGAGSQIGVVPASVVALVVEGRLPPDVAACVDGSGVDGSGVDDSGPDWLDVADAVDELISTGGTLSGPLYAMGAYGQLDGCFTMVDETAERAARASELLDLAVEHGVPPEELTGLLSWADSLAESGQEEQQERDDRAAQSPETLHGRQLADRAYDLTDSDDPVEIREGAALYARLAEESAPDEQRVLDAQLRQNLALYRAGDRPEALLRLTELAHASSDLSGTARLLDSARMILVVDAAENHGPDAARAAWERARQQSGRFPGPGHQERMVAELRGRQVPWVMGELAKLLRAREQPGRDVRSALLAAEADLASSG